MYVHERSTDPRHTSPVRALPGSTSRILVCQCQTCLTAADALIKTDRLPKLNLQGIAIGNGWIDPIRQYPAYAEFAYTRELIKQDSQDGEFIDAQVEVCNKAIAEKYSDPDTTPINISECELIMLKVRAPFDQQ